MSKFESYLKKIKKRNKPILICGDWNIAHKEIDIKNWKGNKKNSGFLPEERAWIDKIINHYNCVDAFRFINDKPDNFLMVVKQRSSPGSIDRGLANRLSNALFAKKYSNIISRYL